LRIWTSYLVIVSPFAAGAFQSKTIFEPETVVVGVPILLGTVAQRIVT